MVSQDYLVLWALAEIREKMAYLDPLVHQVPKVPTENVVLLVLPVQGGFR